MKKIGVRLFSGISLASLASAAALAQGAPQAATGAASGDQGAAPVLGEVVVTAQRREQSLQDVPISVSAFDAESIAAVGAETVADLDTFTPGLSINSTSVTQPRFSIRGVETDDFGIGTEPSVGIFIDGVYSARTGSSLIFFNDVERVEVLKGPQGTLFGRNTSAGAISIITNKPNGQHEAFGTLQLGNYGKVRVDATGNLPITDTLSLRVNGVFNRRDGYLEDALTGEDRERENNTSARAALRWTPTPDTDFILTYDHDDTDKDGPTAIGISDAALTQDPYGPFSNDVIDHKETRILDAVSLTASRDFALGTLTSITAYKEFETHNREDEDGTADPTRYFDTENIEHNESFYQELRFSHDGDRLSFLMGGSYFRERGEQTSAVVFLSDSVDDILGRLADFPMFTILDSVGLDVFGIPYQEDMDNLARNESYAVYGDATYDLTPELSLTAGLRYTHDRKSFTWENGPFISAGLEAATLPGAVYNAILGASLFPAGASVSAADFFRATIGSDLIFDVGPLEGVSLTRAEEFEDVSPRFVVDYRPNADLLLYASAARGYKAGGFNSTELNSFFEPESVWNYEAGFKSDLLDRRVRLNASIFSFTYKNRQSISLEQTSGCTGTAIQCLPQYITRSGDSEAWGVDIESQFAVTPDLTVSLSGGYIDSTWATRIERGVDISGQPTGEPKFKGVVSAHYDRDIAKGSVFADVSYSYTSEGRLNDAIRDRNADIAAVVNPTLFDEIRKSENMVNARLGWRDPNDRYTASIWVENLLDEERVSTLSTLSAGTFGTPYVRLDRPRLFGVELGVRY